MRGAQFVAVTQHSAGRKPVSKHTHANTSPKVKPRRGKKSRPRAVETLDLRGDKQAGEICDKIVYLRSLRHQCNAALQLLKEQAEAKFAGAASVMTDRHLVKLVEHHIPERTIPATDSRYYSIKEVKNLGDIFDVINKSTTPTLKVVP
jgi:hypothetical protein